MDMEEKHSKTMPIMKDILKKMNFMVKANMYIQKIIMKKVM